MRGTEYAALCVPAAREQGFNGSKHALERDAMSTALLTGALGTFLFERGPHGCWVLTRSRCDGCTVALRLIEEDGQHHCFMCVFGPKSVLQTGPSL